MTEYSPPADPDNEALVGAEELGDASEGPLSGMRTDPELPEELPQQTDDPGDRTGLHDRAGDTQDYS